MLRKLLFVLLLGLFIINSSCSQSSSKVSATPPLDVKIGQMLTIGFRGMAVADTNHVVRDIEQYHLGGVVLFDYDVPRGEAVRNIKSPQQVQTLVAGLKALSQKPLIVSIDQEGGKVARLKPTYGFPKTVSAQYLGTLNNADTTRFYARRTAETLSTMGINVNFAPVVDLNVNPDNPIIGGLERSFSANPQVVTKNASIEIETFNNYKVQSVLKHFPGHGSSKGDSHLGVVDVTQTWSKKELDPYKILIDSNEVDAIMTAHIFNAKLDSSYPATMSKPTITGILRDSLGYNGLIFSDDMMMGAIRKEYGLKTAIKHTIEAGVDVLVFANNSIYDPDIVPKAHDIIKELIANGTISRDRINSSYDRIMDFKNSFDQQNNTTDEP